MRRRFRGAGKRALTGLAILGISGTTAVVADRNLAPRQSASPVALEDFDLSPHAAIDLRFSAVWSEDSSSPSHGLMLAAGNVEEHLSLFDPEPLAPPPAVAEPEKAAIATHEIPTGSVAARPAPRPVSRPDAVLNDSQIATIKRRLKLTPDQEQMWPAVEAALRSMKYAKKSPSDRRSGADAAQVASIASDSAQVQRLKSAAFPLLMSFNAEQKREVRELIHVIGLDKLASQF